MLGGLGRFVANKFLKFPQGTTRSSLAQLYITFLLSGIIHFSVEFVIKREITYCSLKFFPLQAAAITFEDVIVYLARRLLLRAGIAVKPEAAGGYWGIFLRILGRCWVVLWFCFSLPILQDGNPDTHEFNDIDKGYIAQFLSNKWKYWGLGTASQ
jgi:hypothetical protein